MWQRAPERNPESFSLNLMTKPQSKKFCWLHSATASCFSKTLLKINSVEEKKKASTLSDIYCHYSDTLFQGAYLLGHRITGGNTFHISRTSQFFSFWKLKGNLFLYHLVWGLCAFVFVFLLQHYTQLPVLNLQAVCNVKNVCWNKQLMYKRCLSVCQSATQQIRVCYRGLKSGGDPWTSKKQRVKNSRLHDDPLMSIPKKLVCRFLMRRKNQNAESEGSNALVYSE